MLDGRYVKIASQVLECTKLEMISQLPSLCTVITTVDVSVIWVVVVEAVRVEVRPCLPLEVLPRELARDRVLVALMDFAGAIEGFKEPRVQL